MTLDVNVPVHEIEILLDDVETEADAVVLARVSLLDLLEGAENSIHVLRFNTDAGIHDGKFDTARVGSISHSHLYATLGRKLERITDKILENFLELGDVGHNLRQIGFYMPVDLQAVRAV